MILSTILSIAAVDVWPLDMIEKTRFSFLYVVIYPERLLTPAIVPVFARMKPDARDPLSRRDNVPSTLIIGRDSMKYAE